MIGTRLFPVAVNSYSTLIGTSGKTVRFTSPSASNICSVLDNTLVDISGICLANWLKRVEPFSFRMKTTNNAHLLPKRATTFRIGQISMTSNPQPIGFSGILLAKRQNSFYCTYFLHNRNVADTKSPYPIKRLEVIRWFNQKSMVFNQSLS